jgi:hypothetical protein
MKYLVPQCKPQYGAILWQHRAAAAAAAAALDFPRETSSSVAQLENRKYSGAR